MSNNITWRFASIFLLVLGSTIVGAENPYRIFNWKVSYGNISPLGVRQRGILINGQFPGPNIYSVTNDNLIINVQNDLPEPFLLSWSGIQNRKTSFQDGVAGTNCPIPAGKNFTYKLQMKDQIGSYYYFPSLAFHKAAGGFGAIKVLSRPSIPVPFAPPSSDMSILIGDWYKTDHKTLQAMLDAGKRLPAPHGVQINGRGLNGRSVFTVQQGTTFRFRISNVGVENTLNFRIQGHSMQIVEIEGTHTVQNTYTSLDVHVGQSYSVLVTANQIPKDYYIVVSTRFNTKVVTTTALLRYKGSKRRASGPLPAAPAGGYSWSLGQARSYRSNLTASGPRPNPQGSYKYGQIKLARTIRFASSAGIVNGKQRYGINSVSYRPLSTPLKLADYYKIPGVFRVNSMPAGPTGRPLYLDNSVIGADYRTFIEIVFENYENVMQSFHLNGYNFRVVGMDFGKWSPASRGEYNLMDAVSRSTTQVYPRSWTAVYVALDNVGMWNIRTDLWARNYLGQQTYLRVFTPVKSLRDEYLIPQNALLCGKAAGRKKP